MHKFVLTLVIVGALNWLLVGLFEWDLVSALLGGDAHRESSWISRAVYLLVGLCGIYSIRFLVGDYKSARA